MVLNTALLALLAGCALTMAVGGVIKGALGVGLSLVAVPLLCLMIPAPQAIGLLVMPVMASNVLQAWQNGRLGYALRRFGPLLLTQLVGTVLAVYWSQALSIKDLNAIISATVILAVVLMVLQPSGQIPLRHQRWAGPLVGALAGAVGGLSSLTGPMLITYLMALRLPKDEFVGSISIIYFFGSLPMYVAMLWWDRFGWSDVGWSCLAMVPAYLGMHLGGLLRGRMSEVFFRRALMAFLSVLALMLLLK